MSSDKAAARVLDEIQHTSALTGFLVGALVGLAVGVVVVAATVATGGAALAVVAAAGAAAASTGGMALVGGALGKTFSSPAGALAPPGAITVLINDLPAVRCVADGALCTKHPGGPPKPVASGALTVAFNDQPAGRVDEDIVCGATIAAGSPNVLIGGPSIQLLDVSPEIPAWMTTAAQWLVIGGTIVAIGAGAAAAYVGGGLCALIGFAGQTIGGFVLGKIGSDIGGYIGEALGGERGRIIGEFIGGAVGGYVGGKLGGRATSGHPVDVATGELFTEATDFTLAGPLPLVMQRVWMSSSAETGATGDMGPKWHHTLGLRLYRWQSGGGLIARLEDGRLAMFPTPQPDAPAVNCVERLVLEVDREERGEVTHYRMRRYDGGGWSFRRATAPDVYILDSIFDANDNRVTFEYGPRDALRRITDSAGRTLGVQTDDHRRITAIDAPHPDVADRRRKLVHYAYSVDGDLIAVTDARGNRMTYAYTAHLLTQERGRGGLTYSFEWDDVRRGTAARCVRTWGESASGALCGLHLAELSYDEQRSETRARDARGVVVVYRTDGRGNVAQQSGPEGLIQHFVRDRAGNLIATRDSLGRNSAAAYDTYGRIIRHRDPDGVTTAFTYASDDLRTPRFGCLARIDHAEHGTRTFQHDDRGNVEKYTDPGGVERRYLRDTRGLPLAVLDELGTAWRWQWSAGGELVAEGPDTPRRFYTLDALGRLVAARDTTGHTARYRYDANGNVVELDLGDGRAVRLAYDAEDRLCRHTDPLGRTTEWEYDGLRSPVSRREPSGALVRYGYDLEMRPVRVCNAAGDVHELAYDDAGRLGRERCFDGRETEFHYDIHGHLVRVVEGERITTYKNDARGRVLEKRFADGAIHRFTWAPCDRVASADTPHRKLAFKYDAVGRIVSERQDGFEMRRTYDARGRLVATTLPDGEVIAYTHTPAGEYDAVRFGATQLAACTHDSDGRVVRQEHGVTTETRTFDMHGLLREQTLLRAGERDPLVRRDYAYHADNALATVRDSLRGSLSYRYDDSERLVATDGWAPDRFAYDRAGNLVGRSHAAASGAPDRPMFVETAPGNRLLGFGAREFTFDAQGNLAREVAQADGPVTTEFRYGANNMLVEVRRTDSEGITTTEFQYDAFNRRVAKTTTRRPRTPGAPPSSEAVRRTTYLWNGDVLLSESSRASDPLRRLYVFEPGGFEPLAVLERPTAKDVYDTYFYVNDRLGTPQEVVDRAGRIIWAATYEAWGSVAIAAHDGFEQPLRFAGQHFDPETGLHYNRNRYYDPTIGRYIQPDPISLLGGLNTYEYTLNPVNFIDPFGLTPLNAPGYSLYHIVNKQGKVVYVGITNDPIVRQGQHAASGRLGRYELIVKEQNLTYGQARGYEQADIKHHDTRNTSRIGKPIRPGEPNRVWSYDPSRTDKRAKAFNKHYKDRMSQNGGCK